MQAEISFGGPPPVSGHENYTAGHYWEMQDLFLTSKWITQYHLFQSLEYSEGYFYSPVMKWNFKILFSANGKACELSSAIFQAAKTSWVFYQLVLSDCQSVFDKKPYAAIH